VEYCGAKVVTIYVIECYVLKGGKRHNLKEEKKLKGEHKLYKYPTKKTKKHLES